MRLISDFSKLLSPRFKALPLLKVKKRVAFMAKHWCHLASQKIFALQIRRENSSG